MMRDLLNLTKHLFEAATPTEDELASMKSIIANKIKELPLDDDTAKTLREIEDLLSHISAGGKSGIIGKELQSIADPTVTAAQKMLARYILSINMTPDQRNELFTLWKEDKLVNQSKLLATGKKTIADVITNYSTNPAIQELTDDLMSVQALGQGKGEFALSVLSKSISKPDKGDLLVSGRKVEVKTTDGGAGRFTDQEVRPGSGFEQAARELNDYVTTNVDNPVKLPRSGLSLTLAAQIASNYPDVGEFIELCKKTINLIFDNTDNSAVNRIGDAIKAGNGPLAMQEYAKLSFNYYMDKKDDEGVLYINLTKEPTMMVYFKDADELTASSLRLHAGTVYITSVADVRLPYPQMEIVDTTFGANAAAQAEKQLAKANKKSSMIDKKIADIGKPSTGIRPPGAREVRTPQADTSRQKR
jgi:hypothetical protein